MTIIATTWLAFSLAVAAYAWFGYRHVLVLPVIAFAAAVALWVPTGTPRYTAPPPGHYTVVGVDIEVPSAASKGAIYILLKEGGGPATYYILPYHTSDADNLQAAMDAAAGNGGVAAQVDGEGGVAYDGEPPVKGDEVKVPEAPEYEVGR